MSTTTPVPGSPEHNAAMIALADQHSRIMISDNSGARVEVAKEQPVVAPEAAPAVVPAAAPEGGEQLILGKFKTQADLEAAYQELQRKQSAPAPKPAATPKVEPQVDHKAAVDAAIAKVVAAQTKLASAADDAAKTAAQAELTAANAEAVAANAAALAAPQQQEQEQTSGLNSAMELAAKSFNETGDISEEAFVALEAQGITREYATQYATGLKAQAELVEVKTYAEVGGKDKYAVIKAWADTNLTAEQKATFNESMQKDLESFLGQVRTMKQLYEAAQGRSPAGRIEVNGGSNAATPVSMFRSEAEVTKAMSDPRYASDPAFRKDVEQKLLASMNAGLNVLR
jgi:hypothetical protein